MEKRKKKGFTLIEMIVVLAIIAILAGIAVPQALNSIKKSKISTDIANAKAIAGAITQGLADGKNLSTTNSPTIINATNIEWIDDYLSTIPEPKVYSEQKFMYTYDGTTLRILVNNMVLYPNPDNNYGNQTTQQTGSGS